MTELKPFKPKTKPDSKWIPWLQRMIEMIILGVVLFYFGVVYENHRMREDVIRERLERVEQMTWHNNQLIFNNEVRMDNAEIPR
jgi:hypothetical protein